MWLAQGAAASQCLVDPSRTSLWVIFGGFHNGGGDDGGGNDGDGDDGDDGDDYADAFPQKYTRLLI